VPIVNNFKPTTRENAQAVQKQFGSIPGGVVLEGKATGLGRIGKVRYHAVLNALMLDDRAAYFAPIPPVSIAVLCRAIAQDERVGVSLGSSAHLVYGAVPPDSDLAFDLKLADHFLGDIVFARKDWTEGYKFANGFDPQRNEGEGFSLAVFFSINGFAFKIENEEVQLTSAGFDVQLIPLSEKKSETGGHLPDLDAIAQGRASQQYELNARHVASEIEYYRQERIVERIFFYGEVAALIRGLKAAGVNLRELARTIEVANGLRPQVAPVATVRPGAPAPPPLPGAPAAEAPLPAVAAGEPKPAPKPAAKPQIIFGITF